MSNVVTLKLQPQERALSRRIADEIADDEPTVFAHEGWFVFLMRYAFVQTGWPWELADMMAHAIFNAALVDLKITRPPWAHGQPEWVHPSYVFRQRTRCVRCGWKLPEDRPTFCSDHCRRAAGMAVYSMDRREELAAWQQAYRAAWSAAQPERRCHLCGDPFRPKSPTNPDQRFCSVHCRNVYVSHKEFNSPTPRAPRR